MKKKNLLLGSLSMLVIAVVAFTGATYAWFVTGRAPTVSQIDASVINVGKIMITPYGPTGRSYGDFSYNVTESSLETASISTGFYHNPNNAVIGSGDPLNATSAVLDIYGTDGTDGTGTFILGADVQGSPRLQFAGQGTSSTSNVPAEAYGADDDNYIAFDLYFLNTNVATATDPSITYGVALDLTTVSANLRKSDFYVKDAYNGRVMTAAEKALPKALRVAFVTYDPADHTQVDKTRVFQPNGTELVLATDTVARNVEGGLQNAPIIAALDDINAAHKADVKTNALYPTTTSYIELFNLNPYNTPYGAETVTTLASNYSANQNIVKLTVYIWIEGNDPDCVSGVAGGIFTSALTFTSREGGMTP